MRLLSFVFMFPKYTRRNGIVASANARVWPDEHGSDTHCVGTCSYDNIHSVTKPIIITDFDGVLNAFPDDKTLRRGGIGHTEWMKDGDPRKELYSDCNAFRLDGNERFEFRYPDSIGMGHVRIHFSHELADRMRSYVDDDVISKIIWLTTWQPYTGFLDAKLGWNGITETAQWYDADMPRSSQRGKIRWLESFVRDDVKSLTQANPDMTKDEMRRALTPIIWIDDEMVSSYSAERITNTTPAPILFMRPDDRIGISREQAKLIDDWLHDDARTVIKSFA